MTDNIHVIRDSRTGRLRARTVDAQEVAEHALETGRIQIHHGGGVPHSYGYPAETEAVLAVPVDLGGQRHVAVYCSQLPAYAVTLGGAAEACMPGARPIFDGRYGPARKDAAVAAVRTRALSDVVARVKGETKLCSKTDVEHWNDIANGREAS